MVPSIPIRDTSALSPPANCCSIFASRTSADDSHHVRVRVRLQITNLCRKLNQFMTFKATDRQNFKVLQPSTADASAADASAISEMGHKTT